MARYIDADKLKDEFCEACSTNKRYHLSVEECRGEERPHHKWCFKMRLIDETPTADVAPRAEVDLYKRLNDELEDELASTYDKLENARAEVAREIFEEIREKGSFSDPCVLHIVLSFDELAELKKKYTGDQS